MSDDYEQPHREPVPRAWREEFDGLKPIRPRMRSHATTDPPRPARTTNEKTYRPAPSTQAAARTAGGRRRIGGDDAQAGRLLSPLPLLHGLEACDAREHPGL